MFALVKRDFLPGVEELRQSTMLKLTDGLGVLRAQPEALLGAMPGSHGSSQRAPRFLPRGLGALDATYLGFSRE